ncbi:hypothetical protein [Ferrimicrobium sp.]|uniref:hypothetical protein n=1 Tax=Ferrimicrobium sp. TaxID=2926050 RepID=UPI00260EA1DD|nr:hypothetical protein [Ferrimicrobium sp.]
MTQRARVVTDYTAKEPGANKEHIVNPNRMEVATAATHPRVFEHQWPMMAGISV